jgi:hypothetical protein
MQPVCYLRRPTPLLSPILADFERVRYIPCRECCKAPPQRLSSRVGQAWPPGLSLPALSNNRLWARAWQALTVRRECQLCRGVLTAAAEPGRHLAIAGFPLAARIVYP